MPSSRDHRSRSRERPSPETDNKSNGVADGDNNDNHLEHIIRKVLALALNKFDNNANNVNSPKEDSRTPTTERERGDRGGGDNDLAKLVLSHVLQFGVRRYLKSREKKKVKAVKGKTNVKMPSRAPRAPRAPIGGPLPLNGGPPGAPADRGLPGPPVDRDIGSASQYYYPPSPQRYCPPPRYDPGEDRRQERRERYERRLERERLEQLERMRRGEWSDRQEERPYRRRSEDLAPNPPLPRRVPREPLPKSTSFQEPQLTEPQELPPQHDYARERRARRRRQEAAAATPQTPQTPLPAHLQWQRDDTKYARRQPPPPQDRPIRPREAPDDTAPRLQPPPPRLFSWESVPVYPPPPTRRDSRPTDLPTPPISPKKAPTFTDKQIGIPPLPYDDLRRALDDLILQLRRTDSIVYRTVYRHHHHHHGHHQYHHYSDDPERRRLLRHTSALRRSMAETKAEARGMKDALGGEFRIQTETGEFRIQTERERERVRRSEERPRKRVTVQLPGEESVDRR